MLILKLLYYTTRKVMLKKEVQPRLNFEVFALCNFLTNLRRILGEKKYDK